MSTSTSATTTTTTTTTMPMRPSQRVLLEAFPAPPSHIPNPTTNPPPSGPPALPLPPVPGPSRVSVDEQLLFLSSVVNRSRRSSKYSVASSHRDSVVSIGSTTSRRASIVSSTAGPSRRDSLSPRSSPRTPSFFIRPSISVSSADQHTKLTASPPLLSDIEDDESEAIPSRMPSPFLDSSWRRSKHQHNESISSIDVRHILAVDEEPAARPLVSPSSPPLPHSTPLAPTFSHIHSLPPPKSITKLQMLRNLLSSSSNPPSSPLSPTSATSISDTTQDVASLTVKDLRLERRAERTKSAGLKREFAVRSRSRGPARNKGPVPAEMPPPMNPVTKTTLHPEMTLDELGPLQDFIMSETPRTPSPDIESILSQTPRPALKKAASQSRLRSPGIIHMRMDSASNPDFRRRASEGVVRDPSWSQLQRIGALVSSEIDEERTMGSDDESTPKKSPDGDESDSSIDLHTPLPNLMVRDGLLSSNSRLLPTSTRRRDGRSDSVITTGSTFTKTGILKDERDTPMRRVRHRDNRLLKGGIGLTTGLGWSDSEDEDAPSPLTRRLSTLDLSRRSSASSVRTTGSMVSHRHHPLSRSYSSGALIESEFEHLEEDEQTVVLRPRVPSLTSRPALAPTSWQTKPGNGTRTSTSSVDTALSDGVPRRPSKLGRPSSALRDSSGSSENYYDRSSLRRKGSPGNDRTSSSTASTLSIGMPSTPREYDPTMSSPAGFGSSSINKYNMEKSLPPLPSGVLKKQPSNSRLGHLSSSFNFPRTRAVSSTSSSVPSPTSPSPSPSSPVRPLHLPRQAARVSGTNSDRAAVPVPVPSVLSSLPRTPPPDKTQINPPPTPAPAPAPAPGNAVRPRPRTGTGMVYRTTSGSRIRAPMTLSSSTSLLERATPLGSLGRINGSRILPPV